MKKIKCIVMISSIVLYNLLVFINVVAEDMNQSPFLKILNIKQGTTELEKVNGKYVISSYDEVLISYEIDNYDSSLDYSINISTGNNSSSMYDNSRVGTIEIYTLKQDEDNYNIKLCDDYQCNTLYNSIDISFDFSNIEEYSNHSTLRLESITQAGNAINKEIYGTTASYSLNAYETTNICIKTNNLLNDVDYKVTYSYDLKTYKGSELNAGICLDIYPKLNQVNYIEIYRNDVFISDLRDENNMNVYINYNNYGNYPYFEYNIFYNINDEEITSSDINGFSDVYTINTNKVCEDNSISLILNGTRYDQNENYNVLIEGYYINDKIFNKSLIVSGSDLNKNGGYKIDLENYLPKLITDYGMYDVPNTIYVTVGNIVDKISINYSQYDINPTVSSNIFYEDGKKNLSTFRGNGGFNWDGGIADTNKLAFSKYSSIYLNYVGSDFEDDEVYDYILEYGYMDYGDYYAEYHVDKVLSNGTINGYKLNTVGAFFKVDNSGNYEMPFYRFTVKKGDEILFSSVPTLDLVDSPTLANVSLKANSKNLYLQTSDMTYTATRNAPIKAIISGIGFEEDKNYEFTISVTQDDDWEHAYERKISFTGKELNEGKASFTYNESLINVHTLFVYVYGDIEYNGRITSVQGGFDINLVDSKDLFPTNTKYVIDNGADIIKNISKSTNVVDFTNDLVLTNNGRLKIYKNGEENTSGKIGTGMVATVVNELDEKIIDMDIVVKGDVTGDGEISITDLVKVADHVAEVKTLSGVYEIAGNITETGNISITDLVKIADDVAGIKEIK